MAIQLEKIYDPKNVENKWYKTWKEKGYFHANEQSEKSSYVVLIPPPNVTGILTMGHVLNNTFQDILVRYARMNGYETLWLPGTDHAGIATQSVVEKQLKKDNKTRFDFSREDFVDKVWEWADRHKSIIFNQLEQLGSSFDRSRERFTFDDGLSHAVREVFVHLYKKGLIYRGRKIINWCPASGTALSNEEVNYRDLQGKLWYFKYPFEDKSGYLTVATTRPETMLGDSGIAVNPKDERYAKYVGKNIMLPIQNRIIPIVADDFVDPEFGTGAVKVTPAHDPNDFDMGQRHNLEQIVIMNPDGTMNETAGKFVSGMDRFEARKIVVAEMEKLGFLEKIEEHSHSVGFSERAGVMIEPYLSEQWFVKMESLAKPAIKVVEEGKIKFHPERWVKTYNHWMTNIKDWCISRQLWWGHRIPVFYCDKCKWQDALIKDPTECPDCGGTVRQDQDVLDTWFSSWLWPFSTMGWPEKTDDLKSFYPTNDLVTAPDIIFFWVARMIMASLEFMGEVPFTDVYFTGIIRDIDGRKMSKSLGNSPDPLDLIEKYGADALRFGVMLIAPQGQDILFSEDRLEVGRNFMNKIWNASRFIMMNLEDDMIIPADYIPDEESLEIADKWILSRLSKTIQAVEKNLSRYRFDEVGRILYDFIWSDYCDWYIELIKDRLYNKSREEKKSAIYPAVYVLKNALKLLHPYTPFITEEIFQKLKTDSEPDIIVSNWPKDHSKLEFKEETVIFPLIQEMIVSVRTVRSEINIPPAKKLNLVVRGDDKQEVVKLLKNPQISGYLKNLARVDEIFISQNVEKPNPSASVVVQGTEIFIPLEGIIDLGEEKERLEKEIRKIEGQLKGITAKLSNQNFISRAPKEVVEREKEKESYNLEKLEKLRQNLQVLSE